MGTVIVDLPVIMRLSSATAPEQRETFSSGFYVEYYETIELTVDVVNNTE